MVTKQQAMTERHFHMNGCSKTVGPRGGETFTCYRWRASGMCQTWKTRPDDFRLPIKFGMYRSYKLTQDTAHEFHVASECPVPELRGY